MRNRRKILGLSENIEVAKERVLEKLDARASRVTTKMDISYNDHSSIIGTSGFNIKQIMDETKTHIHFPDSNKEGKDGAKRANHNAFPNLEGNHNNKFPPKSNQVSLNGTLEGVEKARAAVRYTSPLTISFETPVSETQKIIAKDEYIESVKAMFNVKMVLEVTRPKLHNTTVMVKGTEQEAMKTKEATQIFINYMCDTLASQTKVSLHMEISTQHHESIKGNNGQNLLQIMEETKTTIIIPDCRDANISKKSHVVIKGSIDGVYLARQQLIGNLLVTLSFDYSDYILNTVDFDALMKKYGVGITCRDKNKQQTKTIVIKGKEKFVDKIYEARHEILKLTTPLVKTNIPKTYFSKTDEFAYQNYAYITNRSSPPHIHHLGHSFGLQMDSYQNLNANFNLANMARMQYNRQRIAQNSNNFLSPHPQHSSSRSASLSPVTSGYNSALNSAHNSSHNSFNSSGSSSRDAANAFDQQIFLDRNSVLIDSIFDNEKTPTRSDKNFDFEQKKNEGYKAMRRVLDGESVQTPTPAWVGLGLSKTSPFSLETVRKSNDWDHNDASPSSLINHHSPFGLLKTAGIVDAIPSNMLLGQHKDLQSLLIHLGLDHYISTFHNHEIDLELFSTLTEDNLLTLGIHAFGARKKLLMAVHQLNASKFNIIRQTKFS